MKTIETILLIVAYSAIIITIFVSLICYKRNIEKWETIAFSISLLLLIISITNTTVFNKINSIETTDIFVLLSMILISLTTPLSVMVERQHKIRPYWIKMLYAASILLFSLTCIAYFLDKLKYLENVIVVFLGASVMFSMILVSKTKPQKNVAHLERTNRIFAVIFLIVVPISLIANYIFTEKGYQLKIGFTLPLVFILLSLSKLFDDLQRLAIIKPNIELNEQHFKNHSLTDREKDVAKLLVKGKSYLQISEELFISIPTVKTHSSNIYKKCNVKNRHQLTVLITN